MNGLVYTAELYVACKTFALFNNETSYALELHKEQICNHNKKERAKQVNYRKKPSKKAEENPRSEAPQISGNKALPCTSNNNGIIKNNLCKNTKYNN